MVGEYAAASSEFSASMPMLEIFNAERLTDTLIAELKKIQRTVTEYADANGLQFNRDPAEPADEEDISPNGLAARMVIDALNISTKLHMLGTAIMTNQAKREV